MNEEGRFIFAIVALLWILRLVTIVLISTFSMSFWIFNSRHGRLLSLGLTILSGVIIYVWTSTGPHLDKILGNELVYSNRFNGPVEGATHSRNRFDSASTAAFFNGRSDYMIQSPSSNVKNDLTFCFWLKPLSRDTAQALIVKGENCPDGNPRFMGMSFEVWIHFNNHLRAKIFAPGGNHLDEFLEIESKRAIPKLQWTFVSLRYDNNTKSFDLSFNGKVQQFVLSSKTVPANFPEVFQSPSTLKIGADENYCDYKHKFASFYKGYLDDILIFGRRLSDDEVDVIAGNHVSRFSLKKKSTPLLIALALLGFVFLYLGWAQWRNPSLRIRDSAPAFMQKHAEDILIFTTILAGVALAIVQYASNVGMWTDEILLGLNILRRTPGELLQPLDFHVVGPILFIEIEKFFSWCIPDSDLALRMLPLLAYIGASYFFYRVLREIHTNKSAILAGIALFAFNSPLIYYASEVKQYMVDIFVLSVIYFLVLKPWTPLRSKFIFLGIFGTICIWISNVSPIILFTAGVFLILQHGFKDFRILMYMATTFAAWGLVFGIYFYFFIWHNPATDAMLAFWTPLNVFAPQDFFSKDFFDFIVEKFDYVTSRLFQFGPTFAIIMKYALLLGVLSMIIRRKFGYLALTLLPVLLHVFLSSLKMYPVEMRLILYQCPLFILIVSFAVKELTDLIYAVIKFPLFRIAAIAFPIWLANLFFVNGFYWTPFPFVKHGFKDLIVYINENYQKGDGIYVPPRLYNHYHYYKLAHLLEYPDDQIYMGNNYENQDDLIQELLAFHGRRWVIFDFNNEDQILARMEESGHHPEDALETGGAKMYLFEIK